MHKILFMIHGMNGGSWCWEKYARYFDERGYRCIAPTMRHHTARQGETPDPRLGVTSLLDYTDDLERELSKLDTPPDIIGHSMGGLLAQILARRGRARRLVLLTPAPPAGIFAFRISVARSFLSSLLRWGFWRKPFFPSLSEVSYSTLNRVPAEERKYLYDRYVYESGRAGSEIGFFMFDPRRASHVDETCVTCPTLVIAAGKDRITPAPVVRKVAEKYSRVSTFRMFPENGHWVVGEPGWEAIADYVAGWLEGSSVGIP